MASAARLASAQSFSACYATSHLLGNLSAAGTRRLGELEAQSLVPARQIIFREGEPATRIYRVCSGQLKLSAGAEEGRARVVRLASAGDLLGLSSALNQSGYDFTAETLASTLLKVVGRGEFLRFLHTCEEAGLQASFVLARECSVSQREQRRTGMAGSASGRMARLILDCAFDSAEASATCEPHFTMVLTHEELGNMARLSRETTTRVLNQFEKQGLIVRSGKDLKLLRPQQLEQLAAPAFS